MNDLISRQAAVELAMKYCPDDDGAVQCDGDIRELLDELENLPLAQPDLQPTCNQLATDCISRQAVSSWLKQYGQDVLHRKYKFSLMYIWKNLMDLPLVQPEQKWIPVSKRLPEESGLYVITAYDGVASRTTFAKYQKKLKSWELTGARAYWRVFAWMPLPEPYKGESK